MIAFAVGIAAPLFCPDLGLGLSLWLILALLMLLVVLAVGCLSVWVQMALLFLLGSLYGLYRGYDSLDHRAPPSLLNKEVVLEARVDSAVLRGTDALRLVLSNIHHLNPSQELDLDRIRSIQLAWYFPTQNPQAGERWRFNVTLKPIRGFASPGAFDYSGHLLRQGIDARGYVRDDDTPVRLAKAAGASFAQLRTRLQDALPLVVPESYLSTAQALLLGDSSGFSDDQWNALRRSGTIHLMVVSGLHITLFAGIGFLLCRVVIQRLGLGEQLPFYSISAVAALGFAIVYASITGFQLPAQRAVTMLFVPLACMTLGFKPSPGTVLYSALVLVLLVDPLAPISAGFWYSFLTVAALMLMIVNRTNRSGGLRGALSTQLGVFLVVALVGIQLAGEWNPLSPLVNLVAIPLVGLLIVPALVFTLLLVLALPGLSWLAMETLRFPLAALWWLIEAGGHGTSDTLLPALPFSLLLLGAVAVFLLLLPAALRLRPLLVCLLCLSLLGYQIHRPRLRVDLLDVGQGLSVVVQTPNHALLFDTGVSFNPRFSGGNAVVLPFFRDQGRSYLDTMVISHENIDHMGGARHVVEGMNVGRILGGGKSSQMELARLKPCHNGQQWEWDSVKFSMLWGGAPYLSGNDGSCVLLIESADVKILLTGDIGQDVERSLSLSAPRIPDMAPLLERVSLLQVPHHGSASSSSWPFIKTIRPYYAVISAGYRNRFGHPHPAVSRRYRALGSHLLNTADSGTLTFVQEGNGGLVLQSEYRLSKRRYWW
ncbi:DNA internalization-related competence protein ComEC/Rec2 [Aestuariirhabdus sp. LZHN29]|uniref:DNA internalization-related competence protein ComEC/Rec2 n=1 Tax=Aestuariirhabdus sp. LZHN29 TaxID=3417462 RepID=UPI003CFBB66D